MVALKHGKRLANLSLDDVHTLGYNTVPCEEALEEKVS